MRDAVRVGLTIRQDVFDKIEIDRTRLATRDREIRDAGRDGLTPPLQRAVATERRQRAKDLEERVLDEVFDIAVRPEDPEQRVMDGQLHRLEQLALRGSVAVRGSP